MVKGMCGKMSKDSMTKADSLNNSEMQAHVRNRLQGAEPIRKRGYYRAIKRGEMWAHMIKWANESMESLESRLLNLDGPIYTSSAVEDKRMVGLKEFLESHDSSEDK